MTKLLRSPLRRALLPLAVWSAMQNPSYGSWYQSSSYYAIDSADGQNKQASAIADFRRGLYTKPEVSTTELNPVPGFDSQGTWVLSNTGAIAGGKLTASNPALTVFAALSNIITVGKVYRVEYTIDSLAGGAVSANVGNMSSTYRTSPGTYVDYLVSTSGSDFSFVKRNSVGALTIDNVTIREMLTTQPIPAMFADWFNFTRAGQGVYKDSDGAYKVAAVDVPRFDYTNGARQLLLEGGTTNLCVRCEPQAAQISINTATVVDVATNKSTTGTAIEVTRTTTGTPNQGFADIGAIHAAIAVGETYTFSALAKVGANSTGACIQWNAGLVLYLDNTGVVTSLVYGSFNGAVPVVRSRAEGDGFYWLSITATATATGALNQPVRGYGGKDQTNPIGAKGIYTAFMLEKADKPSSRVLTTGSTASRAPDSAMKTSLLTALENLASSSIQIQAQSLESNGAIGAINGRIIGSEDAVNIAQLSAATNQVARFDGVGSVSATAGSGTTLGAFGLVSARGPNQERIALNGGVVNNVARTAPMRGSYYLGRGATIATSSSAATGWYDQAVVYGFLLNDNSIQAKASAYAA